MTMMERHYASAEEFAPSILKHLPRPAMEIDYQDADWLVKKGWACWTFMPSPYATHRPHRTIKFLNITEGGKRALETAVAASEARRQPPGQA